jgi:hypothetical protein
MTRYSDKCDCCTAVPPAGFSIYIFINTTVTFIGISGHSVQMSWIFLRTRIFILYLVSAYADMVWNGHIVFFNMVRRVLNMCRRFHRLLSHFRWLKIYRAWVFQQFMFMWIVVIAYCWSISSYRLLLLLQSILYHMQNLMQIVHLSLFCATKWLCLMVRND